MQTLRRFIKWLGPNRAWTLFGLTAVTGLISLMLQAVLVETEAEWVIPIQNVLVLIWLAGIVVIIVGRLPHEERQLVLTAVGPLVIALGFGVMLPQLFPWFLGAGIGWMLLYSVLSRRSVRREYQQAIRHLRKNEYDDAIKIMNKLIKAEPKDSGHYRFRAELFRLNNKPQRALKDYQHMVDLEPESGVGYNGLAEVYLQENKLDQALETAKQAYALEPENWVTAYNLGMIEDRLNLPEAALGHLTHAVQAGIPESRHLLLVRLWMARAYSRLDDQANTAAQIKLLGKESRGLHEWQIIFESEQAEVLRNVLAEDIQLAQQIADGAGAELLVSAPTTPSEATTP